MGWLERIANKGQDISRAGLIPAHDYFMRFGNVNDDEAGLPQIWKVNGEKNIPWLDKQDGRVSSVYTIPKYEGKVCIFVGMAPSLNKSWEHLKGLSDRYIIIATNSSAQFLIERNIFPHYVVLLDGRPGAWTLDLGHKCKDVTGIFGPAAEPQALRDWPGKIMIVPLGVKDKSLNRRIRKRWGKPLPSGGNALNSAVAIFSLLTEAKIFVFVGNDLSYKDTYYADRPSDNDESAYFFATDVNGEEVRTLVPLYEYKIWLENVMEQSWPEYTFINCSDGILGIDVDGEVMNFCIHMPIDEAIANIEEAFAMEDKPHDEQLKFMYDQYYDHDLGNLQRGRGVWKHIIDNYEFTKGLDVGCGRANGVQVARELGYDVWGCDISEGAIKCWEERGVGDYCKVCPADSMPWKDGEFDFVLCSEVMEHIPEERVLDTFKEIARVGSDKFFFTIALVPESIPLAGYIQTHICLKDPKWWVEKLEEAGLFFGGAAVSNEGASLSLFFVKDEEPYQKGDKYLMKNKTREMSLVVLGAPVSQYEYTQKKYDL